MKFFQTIFGQAIFGALMFMAVITLLEFPLGDRNLQSGLARAVFGGVIGFCSARAFSCAMRVQVARFSREAASDAGFMTLFVVVINALSGNKDVSLFDAVIALVVFTLTYGGITYILLGARDNPDRIKVSVSWRDVVLPWGLIVLMIAVIVITGSRELATIAVALGILFSPVLPYDNDTDGADKRHQKWGIGLCALGVIYYFTVYPDLLEQVALT